MWTGKGCPYTGYPVGSLALAARNRKSVQPAGESVIDADRSRHHVSGQIRGALAASEPGEGALTPYPEGVSPGRFSRIPESALRQRIAQRQVPVTTCRSAKAREIPYELPERMLRSPPLTEEAV